MKELTDKERIEEEEYRQQHNLEFGILGKDYIPKYDNGKPKYTKIKKH